MNVNGINAGAVNLEALLSQLGDVQKTTSAATGKEMLTLSVRADGATGAYTVEFPRMETPGATSPEALAALVSKLHADGGLKLTNDQLATLKGEAEKTIAKTADAVKTAVCSSKGSVMFDIYTLMALLVEVAQKQKEANREIRCAQGTAMLKAIQDQADQQMAAARIGLIVGVVCSAVTVVASASMMVAQSHAFTQQQQVTRNAGLTAGTTKTTALAHADTVAHADARLASVEAKVGAGVANRVEADFAAQLVDDQAGDLAANLDHALAERNAAETAKTNAENALQNARTQLETAQANQQTAQAELDAKKVEVDFDAKTARLQAQDAARAQNPGDANVQAEWAAAKGEYDQAKAAVDLKQAGLDAARQNVADAQNEVALKQNDLALANQTRANAEAALQGARANYVKTVQDVGDQYAEKYQAALDRRENPIPGADKAQLEQDVREAGAEMEMARAYEAKLLAADDVMTPAEQKGMVHEARAEAAAAENQVVNRVDYKKFEHRIQVLSGVNGIISSLGQMGQNVAQGISGMKSAEASRIAAEEKKQESLAEQSNELYEEEQKLIDAVLQLMQSVSQAETQSMRDAIQA